MSTHQPEASGHEVDVRAPLVQQRDELTHPCTPHTVRKGVRPYLSILYCDCMGWL